MGKDHAIIWVEPNPLDVQRVGQYHPAQIVIHVLDKQHPIEEGDTLLHEILHAIWSSMGMHHGPLEEEAIIHRLSTGLFQVFLDNPEVLRYLASIKNIPFKE
jgi:hypothetical protein